MLGNLPTLPWDLILSLWIVMGTLTLGFFAGKNANNLGTFKNWWESCLFVLTVVLIIVVFWPLALMFMAGSAFAELDKAFVHLNERAQERHRWAQEKHKVEVYMLTKKGDYYGELATKAENEDDG